MEGEEGGGEECEMRSRGVCVGGGDSWMENEMKELAAFTFIKIFSLQYYIIL